MIRLFEASYDFDFIFLEIPQGHSVESFLPPLPENGPTAETAMLELDPKGLDDSPVPSATSREEENAETTEATEEKPNPAPAMGEHRRKKLRLADSSLSYPAKDQELNDDASPHAGCSSEGLSPELDASPTYDWGHPFWGTRQHSFA